MNARRQAPAPSEPATALALPRDVYLIGCGESHTPRAEASAQTMGFKAWNLLRMAELSLPVPPAFVIGTRYCVDPQARTASPGAAL